MRVTLMSRLRNQAPSDNDKTVRNNVTAEVAIFNPGPWCSPFNVTEQSIKKTHVVVRQEELSRRWHMTLTRVGLLSIVVSSTLKLEHFNPNVTNTAQFEEFIAFFAEKRQWMEDQVRSFWPDAPNCVTTLTGESGPCSANVRCQFGC